MELVLFGWVALFSFSIVALLIHKSGNMPEPERALPTSNPNRIRREFQVRGVQMRVSHGEGTRVTLDLSQVKGQMGLSARDADLRLKDGGARLSVDRGQLVVSWADHRELEHRVRDDIVMVAPLYLVVEEHLVFAMDLSGLAALGLGAGEGWAKDALLLASPDPLDLASLLSEGRYQLKADGLHFDWKGDIFRKETVTRNAGEVASALEGLARGQWDQVDRVTAYAPVEVREQLFELAQRNPLLMQRIQPALLRDRDPELAWKVARQHGQLEDWISIALDRRATPELRVRILIRLAQKSPAERCAAAVGLSASTELHSEVCRLVGESMGDEAEIAWMALGRNAVEPAILKEVAKGLARTGTKRCLPVLRGLQEGLGPLQLQLKEQIAQALAIVRERAGAVPGALSVAAPEPMVGAVSLPADPGRLAVSRRTEEGA